MPEPAEEEEFDHTKMSFGEHLEELRTAVFKSLAAILIGFLIGLTIGREVVSYIQGPLKEALEKHYRSVSRERLKDYYEQRAAKGEGHVVDPLATAEDLADDGLALREIYLDPGMLAETLEADFPDAGAMLRKRADKRAPADARVRSRLIKIPIFEPIEDDPRTRIIALSTQEPFMVYVKASLIVGMMIASPFVFFFIWEFVAAGLYRHERKYIYIYLPISLGLFFSGAALAYYVAFDYVLEFLLWFNQSTGVDPSIRLNEWVLMVLMLPLGFGVSFQLPLAMLLLERVGIISIEAYKSHWKVAIVVIFALSMVLTPAGDPGSMLLMAVPLVGLYFAGMLMCRYMPGESLARIPGRRKWDFKRSSKPSAKPSDGGAKGTAPPASKPPQD